jgi:hypothetical protein
MSAPVILLAPCLVAFWFLIPIPVYSLPVSWPQHLVIVGSTSNIQRRTGNAFVASDLYGLGIRLAAYLQVLGMLLSCIRTQKRSRRGIKLLASAVCVSLLASWTVLICRRDISPCEAWLVLSLINAYGTPRSAAIKDLRSEKTRGGIAFVFAGVSVLWQSVSFIWFFAILIRELPLIGTANRVWFFAEVDILGWFRILMLIYSSLDCLLLPMRAMSYLCLIQRSFSMWTGKKSEGRSGNQHANKYTLIQKWLWMWGWFMRKIASVTKDPAESVVFKPLVYLNTWFWDKLFGVKKEMEELEKFHRRIKGEIRVRKFRCLWGMLILVMTIAGVEKIIDYNALTPQNDLSQPGQVIPLLLGIITLIEGLASACMPLSDSGMAEDNNTTSALHGLHSISPHEAHGSGNWIVLTSPNESTQNSGKGVEADREV